MKTKLRELITGLLVLFLVTFGAGCVSDSGTGNGEEGAAGEETGDGAVEEGAIEEEIVEEEIVEEEIVEEEIVEEEMAEEEESEDSEFKALMQSANSNYVKALVSTSKKDYNASEKALEGLAGDLETVKSEYVENPPAVYAADKKWPDTLEEALGIAESSRDHLRKNDIEAAHEALEPMRDLFLELHRRNGIATMGDRLTEFHTMMEIAVDSANENDTVSVVTLIPELELRWEAVSAAEAPETADENYEASLEAVELKIHELETAAVLNDEEETKTLAEEMRQAFAQVFAKYGVVIA